MVGKNGLLDRAAECYPEELDSVPASAIEFCVTLDKFHSPTLHTLKMRSTVNLNGHPWGLIYRSVDNLQLRSLGMLLYSYVVRALLG